MQLSHDISGDGLVLDKKKYAFSSKNNASKEIESWGKDYESLAGSMRSAGQLTENVTEARLLQSRIMEMSRDRYKYITQADFNKKFFLNAQQRKTKLMPQLLHGVDVDYWMSKKTARHVPTFSTSASGNARFAFLERLGKQGEKCKDFEEEEDNPFAMPSKPTRPTEQSQIPEFYRIRLKEQEEAEAAKATFPTQPVMKTLPQKPAACDPADKNSVKLPDVAKSVAFESLAKHNTLPPSTPDRKAHLRRRAQTTPAVMRVTDDPRYQTLENSLCNKYTKLEDLDPEKRLQTIIHAHDSLHLPSRQSLNARPKLQKTILEYLRSRGFDV